MAWYDSVDIDVVQFDRRGATLPVGRRGRRCRRPRRQATAGAVEIGRRATPGSGMPHTSRRRYSQSPSPDIPLLAAALVLLPGREGDDRPPHGEIAGRQGRTSLSGAGRGLLQDSLLQTHRRQAEAEGGGAEGGQAPPMIC
jgi:hypothetical protein